MSAAGDGDVRLAVYRHFLDRGRPPGAAEIAETLGLTQAAAEDALRRLDEAHAIALAPGTLDVWLAQPLSAAATGFRVRADRRSWWGACIWDALGIPAMLGEDAVVETADPATDEAFELRVSGGRVEPTAAVAHFLVPARRWWDDLAYT
ncbi:MAG TPA: organomercurial lyase [Gaiellaceae bacterium]